MKKKFNLHLLFCFIVIVTIFCVSCEQKNELEKEGYIYETQEGWYIKYNDDKKEKVINLTQSNNQLSKTYVVESEIEKLIIIGDSQIVYTAFNILANARSKDLKIELENFNYISGVNKVALDVSNVIGEQIVYLEIKGTSSITGGKGLNGRHGESYSYNSAIERATPRDGGNGEAGGKGKEAIIGNNIYINICEYSSLIIEGGSGGNGGHGGHGEGSKMEDEGQAGHAGNGGSGGNGGNAIVVNELLNINNKGVCKIIGGTGGSGGNGGHGGENKDTGTFEQADDAGDGGSGGIGGNGGYAIYLNTANIDFDIKGEGIIVQGGSGGNGGTGGTGGSSCKNSWPTDYSGKHGNGGIGGNGGNANEAVYNVEINERVLVLENNGGTGGSGGKAGNSKHSGANKFAGNGIDGIAK